VFRFALFAALFFRPVWDGPVVAYERIVVISH